MSTLYLPLKKKWFDAIKSGEKVYEYRLNNPYWQKRLIGRSFDKIVLTLGYPKKTDTTRRIELPYRGYEMQTITSEEWDNVPQKVFAIRLTSNGDAP